MSVAHLILAAILAALIAAMIVYVASVRIRRSITAQLTAAQSSQAVAESRLTSLSSELASAKEAECRLSDEKITLTADRERLKNALENALTDRGHQSDLASQLRAQLDAKTQAYSNLESNYRVVVSQSQGLLTRVQTFEESASRTDAEARQKNDEIAQLKVQVASLVETRQGLESRLAEQKTWVEEQTRFFEQKITNAAAQLLEEKSKAFTEVNKRELEALVAPFKVQIREFRERVDNIHTADTRDRGQLHEQIRHLTELNQLVSRQAEDLTKALTITSKATGDWGEMILHKILEDSGLREGKEYVLQKALEGAEADLQRPDAVINLPDGKQVVVDSKVSNRAWKEYCSATDDETRAEKLAEHMASLRAHIRSLSARDYPRSPELKTIDFVLMFVPVEAALLTALSHDDALFTEAWRAKIYLVSPGMLMASLKLIEGMWMYQRRKESADKIAEAGRRLYEKLTVFATTFVGVGEAIDKARGTFEIAQKQLATGKGHAIGLAEKLRDLGVQPAPGKIMPERLIDLAPEESEDEA